MSKGKILMTVSEYKFFTGHGTGINNLCLGLRDLGYEMAIGAFKFHDKPPEGIEIINLKKMNFFSEKVKKFDIIHNNHPKLNYYSLFSSKPFIFHLYGASNKIQELNIKLSILLCKNKISRILAISDSVVYQVNNAINQIPIKVIYLGVDTNYFSTELKRGIVKGKPQLLFVGVLYPHKNIVMLIDSMHYILKKFPKAHLQIVGNGSEYLSLKQKIKKEKLESNIELLGNIEKEELRDRYSSCDVYVTASKHEMLDLPAIEAMSCGKPVVLSDIPVHKEIIEKSKGGKIFPLNDRESLSIMIEKCIKNSKEIGEKGRKFAEENDWKKVSEKVAMIYNELL